MDGNYRDSATDGHFTKGPKESPYMEVKPLTNTHSITSVCILFTWVCSVLILPKSQCNESLGGGCVRKSRGLKPKETPKFHHLCSTTLPTQWFAFLVNELMIHRPMRAWVSEYGGAIFWLVRNLDIEQNHLQPSQLHLDQYCHHDPWWYHDHDNHLENILMGRWLSTQPVSSLAGRVKLHNLPIQASINALCTNLYIKSITAHRIQLYNTLFPYCAYWCAVVYGPQHQSDEAREVMWRMRGLGLEHGIAHFYKYICQCRQIETGGHMWQIWNRIGCIKITN